MLLNKNKMLYCFLFMTLILFTKVESQTIPAVTDFRAITGIERFANFTIPAYLLSWKYTIPPNADLSRSYFVLSIGNAARTNRLFVNRIKITKKSFLVPTNNWNDVVRPGDTAVFLITPFIAENGGAPVRGPTTQTTVFRPRNF